MNPNHKPGHADILNSILDELLTEGPRTEIIRVRVSPKQKAKFAAHSASLGVPSATLAYQLVVAKMSETNGAPQVQRRPEAEHRPLVVPKQPRMFPGARSGRGGAAMRPTRV